jgi:hypothetical protein
MLVPAIDSEYWFSSPVLAVQQRGPWSAWNCPCWVSERFLYKMEKSIYFEILHYGEISGSHGGEYEDVVR